MTIYDQYGLWNKQADKQIWNSEPAARPLAINGPSAGPNSRIFMGPCLFSWTSGGWDAKLTESMVDNGD